jgi:hypothetical protein
MLACGLLCSEGSGWRGERDGGRAGFQVRRADFVWLCGLLACCRCRRAWSFSGVHSPHFLLWNCVVRIVDTKVVAAAAGVTGQKAMVKQVVGDGARMAQQDPESRCPPVVQMKMVTGVVVMPRNVRLQSQSPLGAQTTQIRGVVATLRLHPCPHRVGHPVQMKHQHGVVAIGRQHPRTVTTGVPR